MRIAAVKDNRLEVPADCRFVRLSEDTPGESGPVTMTGNLVVSKGGSSRLQNRLDSKVPFIERDNLCRNAVDDE